MSRALASIIMRGLRVAVGPRLLIAGADLTVGPGARVGLVGPNGSGKSTLLQVLAGLRSAEAGQVQLAPADATVGYLPQERTARPGETVRQLLARRTSVAQAQHNLDKTTAAMADGMTGADEDYAAALDRWLNLGGADFEARIAAIAAELGLSEHLLEQRVGDLSGGQAARAQLAALLLARFDVFLLDEPTNDLDLDGLDRIEQFVLGLAGPVIVVSHDSAFLERTVTAVAEIDEHEASLTRFEGGWQAYLTERQVALEHAEEQYRTYVDRRDDLTARARRQREWSQKGARTAKRSGERDKFIRYGAIEGAQRTASGAKQLDRELARLAPVDKPFEGWDLRLQIYRAGRSGDVVARLVDVVVDYDDFRLGPVNVEIGWGDRVAVVGANGSGKTTLLSAMLGQIPLTAGTRWLGPGVRVGEIGQDRDAFADADNLLEGFQARTGITTAAEARSVLAKFGLSAEHVGRAPDSLSPGERTRATLAVLQAVGVNLLVLDEPTNHLDLPAIEQLEQAVAAFDGTVILVSHDRQLLGAVACNRTLELRDGQLSPRR